MPALPAQHLKSAMGWPYQVRTTNASNTPCEAMITNGSKMLLSSKPKPIDLRMKPWLSCMKRPNNSAARHAEPQNELNLYKAPGTPTLGQPQESKARAPTGIMKRPSNCTPKSKRRLLGPATPNTMTTYWNS